MPRSDETVSLLGDYHRIGDVTTPRSAYYGSAAGSSHSHSSAGSSAGGIGATPRSPFDAGFPLLFSSPAPSPRPHRLSFAHTKDDAGRGAQVCLALLMSVGGAGLFAVPFAFLLAPASAALGVVLAGFAAALSATALLNAHVALSQRHEETLHIGAGKRFASFQALAVAAGGNLFGYAVAAVTALGIFGGCAGSIRIVRDISPFLTAELYALVGSRDGARLSAAASSHWADWFLIATFVVVVFPLCLLKNLSGLRLSSYLSFAFSLYVVAAVVYRSSHPLDLDSSSSSNSNSTVVGALNATETVITGGSFVRFSQSVSLFNYAFLMHLNLLPLFIQLRGSFAEPMHKSRRKMSDYILGVTVFCIFLYLLIGLFARKLYGKTVRGNILLNLESDPMMEIPLLAGFLTTLAGFPLLFQPLRSVLEELIFSSADGEVPFATRLGGTSFLLLSQLLLALLGPGIEVVFIFTGATSCLLICYVFPAAMYTQLFPWRTARGGKLWVIALWSVVAIFTILGVVAACSLVGLE